MTLAPATSEPRTTTERVASHARARHERYGPKLDCEGLLPATSADDGDVYCRGCGLLLFRGGGS